MILHYQLCSREWFEHANGILLGVQLSRNANEIDFNPSVVAEELEDVQICSVQ